jgi:hypothetical protein
MTHRLNLGERRGGDDERSVKSLKALKEASRALKEACR